MKPFKPSFGQAIGIIAILSIVTFAGTLYAYPPTSPTVTVTLTTTDASTVSIIKQETTTATLIQGNTVTQVITSSVTSISTLSTATKTLTENATFTITQQKPEKVQLSGQVKSNTILTTATQIRFVSSTDVTYTAKVTGGTYSIDLPNGDGILYQVFIDYSVNPAGSGSCPAGQLPLDIMPLTYLIAWSC